MESFLRPLRKSLSGYRLLAVLGNRDNRVEHSKLEGFSLEDTPALRREYQE